MGRRLSPDELGDAGEKLFALLCSQAGLISNESGRDRAGWDFVVDLPPDPNSSEALDRRPARSCMVQLKSTSNGNPVRLSLSAIEPLAKDPKPAFVIVFRLTPDGCGISGYLIHVIDQILERILRRLREAEASERRAINKAVISFKHADLGDRFDLTSDGLRRAIEHRLGDDASAYIREKQRQLAELGYDDDRLLTEAIVEIENSEHFSRVLIGLEPLRPIALRTFDVRFGVALPYRGAAFDDVEELRIQPPSMGPCHVSIRGAPLSPAAIFEAEAFVGPLLRTDARVWLLVRHPEFNITFVGEAIRFETVADYYTRRRTLTVWRNLLRGLGYLATGDGELSFQFSGKVGTRLSLTMSDRLEGPDLETLPRLAGFMESWMRLTEMAGVSVTETFSLEDVWAAHDVQLATDMMTNPSPLGSLAFDLGTFEATKATIDGLYFSSCRLGDAAVSYAVKVTLKRFPTEYRSVAFTPMDARPEVLDLQDYGEALAIAAEIHVLLHPDNVIQVAPYPIAG